MGAAVLTPVPSTVPLCGDCKYHMPYATHPGSWCTLPTASLYGQPVTPGRRCCDDAATWPEDSRAPLLVEAFRL
jgi:hypothetical protein